MALDVKGIIEKFDIAQDSLVLQQSDLSLQSVADMVASGAIDINPKYQRRERWDDEKNSGLIESFLLNIPVPPIYLAEDEYGVYSVIDGKQRVSAIYKFLKGNLTLKNLVKFSELENLSFSELPKSLSNALRIRPYLRVVTLLRQSDPDLKHEVFLRLNKAGVALNAQEIRNVAFRGKFNDLLFDLSDLPYLKAQLNSTPDSKIYREMTDVQFVLRFFTIKKYWKNFPGNMDKAMDRFMSRNAKNPDEIIKKQKKDFVDALNFCERIWGDDAFRRPEGSRRVLQGFFDIQMVCSTFLTAIEKERLIQMKAKVKSALVKQLENDEDFYESVSQFTSNPTNVEYRISKFTDILKSL
jgi:Protein of unknown function DUF262